ncbi:MAG: PAS domain S-box protein [Comamonadaceae bacterium]|nr:MAG: PAS domain S-box protein [Comamonadaceae bacterium]
MGWTVLAFVLAAAGVLAVALVALREEAVRNGHRLAESLVQVIAEQTGRTLQAVDARLLLSGVQLAALQAGRAAGEEEVRTMLRGQLQGLPFVRAIWVVDGEGRIVYDTDRGNIGLVLADREYFRIYRERPDAAFHVGRAVRSRSTGTWLLSASRPLRGPGGELRGVIVAAVEPPYFEQIWKSIRLGEGGAITLFNRQGRLMMRSPADDAAMDRDFSQEPLFTEFLPASPQGLFERRSLVDGRERVAAYRPVASYPDLVVTVGLSHGEILGPWRRFALLMATVYALAAATAAALAFQLQRQSRRRARTDQLFGQLAQAMPQIVFIADAQGKVRFMNERWTESTGHSAALAFDGGWSELIHPDDRAATLDSLRAMVVRGQPMQHEHRLLYRDGSYRWQLLRAVPVRDDAGRLASWFGTSTEIDALKQAQAKLEQQADLLGMASRLARMGGWQVDTVHQRITWSDEASAILDMPAGSSPSLEEVFALFLPASRETTMLAVQECMLRGTPFDVEVEMVTATGRPVWVRSIGEAVRDEQGRVVRIEGAQQDITQRMALLEQVRQLNAGLEEKVAERTSALARQEALFRTLAEQAPMPIWTVDRRGAATFFSRAWYDLIGGDAPRWDGNRWVEVVHPDDVAEMTRNWKRARRTGHYAGTRRLRARDGSYRTTTYRARPVRGGNGEIEFWVGVDADITDITANQTALGLANQQLEAFSYSVSHDLRSPLQRVAAFAQLLDAELPASSGGKARHYLDRIRANTDHMNQLIEGLLALAQVSQMDMVRAPVNISDIAAAILEHLQADNPQRRLSWRVEPGLVVMGDTRLMHSVLENLLGNAWKFTGPAARPEITVGGSNARGEYFVRDNGAGFDMAHADKLFGTFQRLHGDAEFPGTGIGLATVARAIARQGGRIWADAAPGQGATFTFVLPGPPQA